MALIVFLTNLLTSLFRMASVSIFCVLGRLELGSPLYVIHSSIQHLTLLQRAIRNLGSGSRHTLMNCRLELEFFHPGRIYLIEVYIIRKAM